MFCRCIKLAGVSQTRTGKEVCSAKQSHLTKEEVGLALTVIVGCKTDVVLSTQHWIVNLIVSLESTN